MWGCEIVLLLTNKKRDEARVNHYPLVSPLDLLVCIFKLKVDSSPSINLKCATFISIVATPLWKEWGWNSHSRNGNLGIHRDSRNFRVWLQGLKHLALWRLYIIGKPLKCRCRKWAHMSHLDIRSTSYDKKKGRESDWQFDSRPQKVMNRPDPGACRWSATHRWKALDESYKFSLDLIPIEGLSKELWPHKVPGV
jgi:hypothetical protein